MALAQNFIFTDIAFDLTNYLERTYFNYAFKYEQVREILAELINYGILAKKPIYDMQKGNDTEYYTLHFTDILFHNYFIQSILCTEKAKAAADLTFYIYDARRAGCLTKDKIHSYVSVMMMCAMNRIHPQTLISTKMCAMNQAHLKTLISARMCALAQTTLLTLYLRCFSCYKRQKVKKEHLLPLAKRWRMHF